MPGCTCTSIIKRHNAGTPYRPSNCHTWWTFLMVRLMGRWNLKPHDTAHLAFYGFGEERCSRSGESWRMLKYPTINDENVLLRGADASSLSPTPASSKSSLQPIMNRIPITSYISTLPRLRSRGIVEAWSGRTLRYQESGEEVQGAHPTLQRVPGIFAVAMARTETR